MNEPEWKAQYQGEWQKPDWLAVYVAAWYALRTEGYDRLICPPDGMPKMPGDLGRINRYARQCRAEIPIERARWQPAYKAIRHMDLDDLAEQANRAWACITARERSLVSDLV